MLLPNPLSLCLYFPSPNPAGVRTLLYLNEELSPTATLCNEAFILPHISWHSELFPSCLITKLQYGSRQLSPPGVRELLELAQNALLACVAHHVQLSINICGRPGWKWGRAWRCSITTKSLAKSPQLSCVTDSWSFPWPIWGLGLPSAPRSRLWTTSEGKDWERERCQFHLGQKGLWVRVYFWTKARGVSLLRCVLCCGKTISQQNQWEWNLYLRLVSCSGQELNPTDRGG